MDASIREISDHIDCVKLFHCGFKDNLPLQQSNCRTWSISLYGYDATVGAVHGMAEAACKLLEFLISIWKALDPTDCWYEPLLDLARGLLIWCRQNCIWTPWI